MSNPLPKPPRASASHIWMRILLWLVPGFAATGIVFGWAMSSLAATAHQNLILIGSLVTLLVVTLSAGASDCVLHLTRTRGRQNV